jgi:4-oxalomesaconate hydratase
VWRAGGAIALYAKRGWHIKIVCLSYGERGGSQNLWKDAAMTLDRVKKERRAEAERAAGILGASDIEFVDLGDYPLRTDLAALEKLADIYCALRPE